MKALLLSAGLGTRLRPITNTIPKCLVPIDGKPLLWYWLDLLSAAGVDTFYINLHYFADEVRKSIALSPFASKVIFLDEEELLGTGGTLKRNSNIFKDDTFFIAHADNLCLTDFSAFFSAHRNRPHECKITMMTFIPPDPKQCGVVELSQDNIVIGFHEKVLNPPTHLANGAVFLMEGSVASFASNYPSDVFEISRDIIPAFLGKIITWHNDDYHLDIGTPDTYARAQSDVEIIRSLVDKYGIQRI